MTSFSPIDFAVHFYGKQDIGSWQELEICSRQTANQVIANQFTELRKRAADLQVNETEVIIDHNMLPILRLSQNSEFSFPPHFIPVLALFLNSVSASESHQLVSWGSQVVIAGCTEENDFGKYGHLWRNPTHATRIAYHAGNILMGAQIYLRDIAVSVDASKATHLSLDQKNFYDSMREQATDIFLTKISAMKADGFSTPSSTTLFGVMAKILPKIEGTYYDVVTDLLDATRPAFGAEAVQFEGPPRDPA